MSSPLFYKDQDIHRKDDFLLYSAMGKKSISGVTSIAAAPSAAAMFWAKGVSGGFRGKWWSADFFNFLPNGYMD